jgi:ribonuclease R
MQAHVGKTFKGVISSITNFGFFVQLQTFFVEGLAHISNLHGDYYIFDEVRMTLRGKRSGRLFHMGQSVEVLLAAANPVKRQLDFELVSTDGEAASRERPGASQHRRPSPGRSKPSSSAAGKSHQSGQAASPAPAAQPGRGKNSQRRSRHRRRR